MTANEFRKLALEIRGAVERSHMHHPDFPVAGKIFASLGYPDQDWAMVKLTPEQQRKCIKDAPTVFKLCSGAWGWQGRHEYLSSRRECEHGARRSRCRGEQCHLKEEEENAQHPTSN